MSTLYTRMVRHQLYLERFKLGVPLSFLPYSAAIEDIIRREFASLKLENFGDLTKARINGLLSVLNGKISSQFARYIKGILAYLLRFMRGEISMFTDMMEGADAPTADAMWSKISNAPLPGNGQLIEAMLKALGVLTYNRVSDTIHKAAANASTTAEALAALVGDSSSLFGTSVIARAVTQNVILVDTIIQHISQMVSASIAAPLFDVYTWVSIIDKGTTAICLDRDGNVYKYGEGPLAPAHYGCRSISVPGDVKGEMSTIAQFLRDEEGSSDLRSKSPLSLDVFLSKIDQILA